MKSVIRAFFKTLRAVLGPFMLIAEYLARPKGLVRANDTQAKVDQECASLSLYQYKTCPFCIKVRQEMHRLSLNIERLDAQSPGKIRDELISQGGQAKVPCLRITDSTGKKAWLYESEEIIKYLQGRFTSI